MPEWIVLLAGEEPGKGQTAGQLGLAQPSGVRVEAVHVQRQQPQDIS